MNICYDETLIMPSSYAIMDEEEMTYVEGGGTAVVYDTASNIRNRLNAVIALSLAGIGDGAAIGALIGGPLGAAAGAIIGAAYFQSWLSGASNGHNQVESIINSSGRNRRCKMTTTYGFAFYCTGVNVTRA